jgi:hypothetical protein
MANCSDTITDCSGTITDCIDTFTDCSGTIADCIDAICPDFQLSAFAFLKKLLYFCKLLKNSISL